MSGQSFIVDARSRAIFGYAATVQAWLAFERALATSQAELGIIPREAAETIARATETLVLEPDVHEAEVAKARHPVVPLIRALTAASGKAGSYVHFGATSQDVTDTGLILCCRDACEELAEVLAVLRGACMDLAERHRHTLVVGRTHGQHAVPTVFGLRAAVWTEQWADHLQRLSEIRPRLLTGSFGGASGTLAGYGDSAIALRRLVMRHLGLNESLVSWHSAYEQLAEFTDMLGLFSGTADRIAREVYLLSRPEMGELAEPFGEHAVGSSTMPHKRNPIASEAVSAAAAYVQGLVPVGQRMIAQRDDRDLTATFLALHIVPEATIHAISLLRALGEILGGLHVNEARMAENLSRASKEYLSEAVLLALAPHLGRDEAYRLVKQAIDRARNDQRSLERVLEEDTTVQRVLSGAKLAELLSPERYLGQSSIMIDSVAARYRSADEAGCP